MQRWEYHTLSTRLNSSEPGPGVDHDDLTNAAVDTWLHALNELGRHGWEVVGDTSFLHWIGGRSEGVPVNRILLKRSVAQPDW